MYSPAKPAPMTTASTSSVMGSRVSVVVSMWGMSPRSAGRSSGLLVGDRARSHGSDDLLEAAFAAGQHQQREEAVHLAVVATEVDGDAGRPQRVGVGLALIAQDVVLSRQHDGRRQAFERP